MASGCMLIKGPTVRNSSSYCLSASSMALVPFDHRGNLPACQLRTPNLCARSEQTRWIAYGRRLTGSSSNVMVRSSLNGFSSRRWHASLEKLKQLVGLLSETNQRKERARRRFLELTAAAKDAAVTSSSDELNLKKGTILEIVKEGKAACVVTERPEGKKSWIAMDQYGNTHSVKPAKIRFVVPGVDDFKPAGIIDFLKKVEHLQDSSLLEIAWHEVSSSEKSITTSELAQILYGENGYIECYATHCMLSEKQAYFRRKQKGLSEFYEARAAAEVAELQRQFAVEENARQEVDRFIQRIRSAISQPLDSKPPPHSWSSDKFSSLRIEALRSFALETLGNDSQKTMAMEVLDGLGLPKLASVAADLLIRMGIFHLHENIELIKSRVPTEFSEEQLAAAKLIAAQPPLDSDMENRVDLRHLKVYTIDSDHAKELDDGLSAEEMSDGRFRVWIHIADPTRWLKLGDTIEKEAKTRGTSIYLAEKNIPMIPMELAIGCMSLRQSVECCAISICVILHLDGSIAETSIYCSTIRPSLRLTYDSANELLMLKLDEESQLTLLSKAASLRLQWRKSQGAVDVSAPTTEVRVKDPTSIEPEIEITVFDMSTPSAQLVSEMMILCGEAVAMFGSERNLVLPYRGQSAGEIDLRALESVPDGHSRRAAMLRSTGAVEMNFTRPLHHANLGLPGYVQFTSPIRRYSDLLAHFQVKAALRNEELPLTRGYLEAAVMIANLRMKEARRLANMSNRYWLLEYLRRCSRDVMYKASVVRTFKEGLIVVALNELGVQGTIQTSRDFAMGDCVNVVVTDVHPRRDILFLSLL